MKAIRILLATLMLLCAAPGSGSQEKPAPEKPASAASSARAALSPVEYRVQMALTEYDGANKISSLPYTIHVASGDYVSSGSLRVGIRVPITTANKNGDATMTYIDVGSNIDVRIRRPEGDPYILDLTIDRSSLYVREPSKEGKVEGREWIPGDPPPGPQPLIHEFRGNVSFLVRDSRTAEATVATDPIT